jgi:hypothetical protein
MAELAQNPHPIVAAYFVPRPSEQKKNGPA